MSWTEGAGREGRGGEGRMGQMEQEEEEVVMSLRDAAMGWILHTDAAGEAHYGPIRDFSCLLVPKQGLHPTGEQSTDHANEVLLPPPSAHTLTTSLPISCPHRAALQGPSALLRRNNCPFPRSVLL